MDINRTIQVTNRGFSPILSIAQGTDMVRFNFRLTDFDIPSGSAAVAYNIQPTGNIVPKTCSISGNTVSVDPPAYYFLRGKNYMQIQITNSGKRIVSFLIEVWCSPNIATPEVVEMGDSTVTQQLLSEVVLLTERLNNLLTNVPEGSEKDSELVDIRVGTNGQVYGSAGDAMRSLVGPGIRITSTSQLASLADAEPNRIYVIGYSSDDKAPDIPKDASINGILVTLNFRQEVNDGTIQIYADSNRSGFYIRNSWTSEGNFGKWYSFGFPIDVYIELLKNATKTHFILSGTNPESPFDDINTFPANSIVAGDFTSFDDSIIDNGIICTIGEQYEVGDTPYGHGAFQIAIGTKKDMHYRLFWNDSWLDWDFFATGKDVEELREMISAIDNKEVTCNLSMFENVGVIGDSYASGGMVINDEIMTKYNISWPQVLKRSTGVDFVNYSFSGATCKSWLVNSNYGKSKVESDDPKQLYLVCLGINDADRKNEQPTGTIADMKDNSEENPDTFFGNYGKILSVLMLKSSKAKIVLVTIPLKNSQYMEYSGYIKSIGEKYNLPVIDSLTDPFLNSDEFQNNRSGGHPLAVGYSRMANSMKKLIENIMLDPYFNDYTGDLS